MYLADSLALAALEMFVHIGAAHLSMQFVAMAVDIPDDLRVDKLGVPLPTNWGCDRNPRIAREVQPMVS